MRIIRLLTWALTISLGLGFIPAEAKVGFDYISAKERKQLFKLVDQYARAEAVMMVCSRSMRVEARVFHAAKPCVTAKALSRIRWYYRKQLAKHKATIGKEFCARPAVRKAFPKVRGAVDNMISKIKSTCSLCLFC